MALVISPPGKVNIKDIAKTMPKSIPIELTYVK